MPATNLKEVSATKLVRDLAAIRAEAVREPVAITSHGRADLVLLSAERFARLSQETDAFDRMIAQAKLDIVLDCVSSNVVVFDHEFTIRHINRAMLRSHSLPDEGWRGRDARHLLPDAVAPFFMKRFEEVLASGMMAEFDFPSELRPGRHIQARLVPWPGGIAYFSDDITDRQTALDRDLELSATRRALTALGERGTGSVTTEGNIASADAGLAAMIGSGERKLIHARFLPLFDPDDRGRIDDALRASQPALLDVHYLRAGTTVRQAALSLSPFLRSDGRHLHAFVIEDR